MLYDSMSLLQHSWIIISIVTNIAKYDTRKTVFDIESRKNSSYYCNIESVLAEICKARWKGERTR